MTPLSRKTPPKRGAGPKRKTPINPVNRARKAKTFQRAYGGKARRDFVASLPCLVCGRVPCDPAHVSGDNGAGYKASAQYTVPLCRTHHDMHHDGAETFAATFGLDLRAEAARVERAWKQAQEAA